MVIGMLVLVVLASAVVVVLLFQANAERAPECPRCGRPTELVEQWAEYVEGGWLLNSRQFTCPICLTTTRRESLTSAHDL